jgi:hypothetical protein
MAAAKANCQKLEKALAEREASMDGPFVRAILPGEG